VHGLAWIIYQEECSTLSGHWMTSCIWHLDDSDIFRDTCAKLLHEAFACFRQVRQCIERRLGRPAKSRQPRQMVSGRICVARFQFCEVWKNEFWLALTLRLLNLVDACTAFTEWCEVICTWSGTCGLWTPFGMSGIDPTCFSVFMTYKNEM